MKTKDIKSILGHVADVVSFRQGIFTAKKTYFWGFTKDGSSLRDAIKKLIPQANIEDYGNHYHSFVGGAKAGSNQSSYLWVKFKA